MGDPGALPEVAQLPGQPGGLPRIPAVCPPSPAARLPTSAPSDKLTAVKIYHCRVVYPQAVRVWEDAWDAFTPFLAFRPPVRKLLYTTNSIVISSLN